VLARGDVMAALDDAVRAGKVRVAAYSGDNAPLAWAVESGRFGVVQCSVSVVDQRALDKAIPNATARGVGVLAKRALANGVWREASRPESPDRATYWDRLQAMQLSLTAEQAIAFVKAQPVSAILVGTTNLEHLRALADITADAGDYRARFDPAWDGVI